jgi:hypothetical protein
MIEKTSSRIQCKACAWTGLMKDLLSAGNPFNVEETIFGCPECNQCTAGFDNLCCLHDCKELAVCGFLTTTNGYLFTCHEHYKRYKDT